MVKKKIKTEAADYQKALSNYFRITSRYIPHLVLQKIESDINTIRQYEENNRPPTKQEIITRGLLLLLGQLIGSIVYSALILYVLKEVLNASIAYELKNILLLTLIIIGYKMKFRLNKE